MAFTIAGICIQLVGLVIQVIRLWQERRGGQEAHVPVQRLARRIALAAACRSDAAAAGESTACKREAITETPLPGHSRIALGRLPTMPIGVPRQRLTRDPSPKGPDTRETGAKVAAIVVDGLFP